MKRSNVRRPAAVLGFSIATGLLPGIVHAQAGGSVTVYGIFDAGVEYVRNSAGASGPATSLKNLSSGNESASRIGFRGTEDLGGGLRASFVLEHGFDIDTGTPTSSSTFWDRNSWVGLSGSWGELRIGRTYTPAFYALQLSDVNDMGLYANAGTYAQLGGSGNVRAPNGINYISPSLSGVTVRALASFGNESATPPKDAGRFSALSVAYKNKQLFASAFWQARKDVFPAGSANSENSTMTGVTGNYDFGAFALGAGVTRYDPAGPDTASAGRISSKWLGVEVRIGVGSLTAQVGTIETRTIAATQPKATLMGIAYRHPLSKRTDLYTNFGRMDNNSAARYVLTAGSRALPLTGGVGGDTTALILGVRHRF